MSAATPNSQTPSRDSAAPSFFDKTLDAMRGLPDTVHTSPSTLRYMPALAIGGSLLYIVQTFRQRDVGDTVFLELASETGNVRLVLPPPVTAILNRQRDALSEKNRKRGARAAVATRKARGIEPAFLKNRARRPARKRKES